MPAKKAKRTPEEKKLLAGPCYICEKKGCQMACLHCGIAFHPHCDTHDHCPNAPTQDGDDEQDMGGVGPAMPPCDGKCGGIYNPIQLYAHKYRQLHGRKMDWHFPSDMLHF